MNGWKQDKRWSDKFLPEIKSILGMHLISEPPIEEDAEHNTDLMVLKLDSIRIGCRIRKNQYLDGYGNEFTIRSGRPSGVKTELTKIIEGWGDYFFYGFCNKSEDSLVLWHLADLKVFRLWFNTMLAKNKGISPGVGKDNTDGSSSFRAFRWNDIGSGFVVASYDDRIGF